MKYEIERKFLVADGSWAEAVAETMHLRDGLVATFGGGKVRVRVATGAIAPARAYVTIKGPRSGIARPEFEYEIPVAEAEIMLAQLCGDQVVEKTRHFVPFAGHVWVVDVYEGMLAGVTYAEVELDHASQDVAIPCWAGPEVTGQPQHSKRTLVLGRAAAAREAAGRRGL
ncbi:CYTH domain-containing protein [Roseomonas terrae]|jgi:adenylate cyclase|uniref:CYTH domain-containing protein n=1 Tax=Neoroseomonas terrae TaxID=424799 RepID=A0ABS5EDJ5_9PROT|nr:CYTH domain-containing protein [Neoroseomonas terrae]MBR0649088.1 CYTH domain-containing protein [Neoroseomonas terrae]